MMATRWLKGACALAGLAAAAGAAELEVAVVAQLACPLKAEDVAAVYGPAGSKYPAAAYTDLNPDGEDRLWFTGTFRNAGEDAITSFTFDVFVWDAAGAEIYKTGGKYEFPSIRAGEAKGKEWSWPADVAGAAKVVFVPRALRFPAGRTWEADERFVSAKLEELRGSN